MNLTRVAAIAGVAVAVAAAPVATLLASPAAADPVKYGDHITIACGELGTLNIASNGNGDWTPGLVADNNQVLVPYRFHFEFTPAGSSDTFTEDLAKPAPKNGRLDECTFGGTDEEGTFSGTAWISYTPSKA